MSTKATSIPTEKESLLTPYLRFCDRQVERRPLWFLLPVLSLSGAVIPLSIFVMLYFDWYIAFMGVSTVLFFSNMVVHVADLHPRVTISVYFFTLAFHIFVPLFSILFLL